MKKFILLNLAALLIPCFAHAGTYYFIDYASGTDTNDGKSTSTPFKHCPGDNNATSTAASTTLAAGDRVIFKGGVQYTTSAEGGIRINWSGTSDAESGRIIYDGDSGTYSTRWAAGNSKAIIDGGGVTKFGVFSYLSAKNYITFNNFIIRNGHDVSSTYDLFPGLIIGYASANYVTISNSNLSDAGYYQSGQAASGYCVYNSGGVNWKVFNNTFTDCYGAAITMGGGTGVSNIEIHNNHFTGKQRWQITFGGGSGATDNVKLYNNTMQNVGKDDVSEGGYHSDWFYLFSEVNQGPFTNLYIYNNKMYNDYSPAQEFGQGYITLINYHATNYWDGVYIYNNVMFNGSTAGNVGINITTYAGGIHNTYILNNTIYQPSDTVGNALGMAAMNSGHYTNVTIKNNLFIMMNAGYLFGGSTFLGTKDIDYNFYYSTKSTPFGINDGTLYEYNFTNWKSTTGYDQHSIGVTTNPLFISTNPASFDLRLQSGSPAVDAGATLGIPYRVDINGTARPQGARWDIGAYEVVSGAPGTPNPPSGLRYK